MDLLGPKLEWCSTTRGDVRILWVFPITAPEHDLLKTQGPEPLEQLFEDKDVGYWTPLRDSVV